MQAMPTSFNAEQAERNRLSLKVRNSSMRRAGYTVKSWFYHTLVYCGGQWENMIFKIMQYLMMYMCNLSISADDMVLRLPGATITFANANN